MPEDERSLQERIAAAKAAKQKQETADFQVRIENNQFESITPERRTIDAEIARQASRTPAQNPSEREPHSPADYSTMEYWQPIYQDPSVQNGGNAKTQNGTTASRNPGAESRQSQKRNAQSGGGQQKAYSSTAKQHGHQAHTAPERKAKAPVKRSSTDKQQTKNNPKGKQKMKAYQPYEEETVYHGGEQKPRKKRHIFRKLFLLVLVLCVGVFGTYSYFSLKMIDKMNLVETGARTDFSGTALMESDKVRNILLIGSDTRYEEENGRSDTMILISINSETDTMTLTSFMRDMYVEIPGYGMDKMNAALVYGGPELVMDTVQENFNVRVEDYVYVDFYSFVDIVDAMGGIEIEISEEEAIGMQAPMSEQNKILGKSYGEDYLSEGGTYRMNGNQALGYARLRYVGNADFERTERQRLVIQKILAKFKTLGLADKKAAAESVFSHLTTNMDKQELYLLSLRAPFLLGYDTQELRIPVDDGWTYGSAGTQSILNVDFETNIEALREQIYE